MTSNLKTFFHLSAYFHFEIQYFYSCDMEYMQRVQERNAMTISLVDDILQYKKKVLQGMVELANIQVRLHEVYLAFCC